MTPHREVAKEAERLTIFMRRPSLCLPAVQRSISENENRAWHGLLHGLLSGGRKTLNGMIDTLMPTQRTQDVPAEERERYWEHLYKGGSFRYWQMNYPDVTISHEANAIIYEFWAKKVRERMTDPVKMQLMAPLPAEMMPYHIFTKRPPLEIDYYEMVNRPNVELVNTKHTPSKAFNETGLLMEDGKQIDFDILILATGFDAFSGS